MVYSSVEQLVGKTPVIELTKLEKKFNLKGKLFAKLEYFNPAGSAKDRIAAQMISDAEAEGKLKKGSVIIEPTSGNTGIGLASIGASKGYKVVIVMPDSMSVERIKLMKAYGAEVVLTPGEKGMEGAISKAEEIKKEKEAEGISCIIAGQFDNPSNSKAHYLTTGPEIFNDMDGKTDVFVAGVGTGGTITGTGKYLKEKCSDIKIVAVEPKDSPLLSEGYAGPHGLQGIGANFVPDVLDLSIIDEISPEELDDAIDTLKILGAEEGIFVGISSGAALHAAIKEAEKSENEGKNILALLTDGGDRYLSTLEF